MKDQLRFAVYTHKLVIYDDLLITRNFIVLKALDGTLTFTDFHRYVMPLKRKVRKITDDGNKRHTYIVQMLNHVFFTRGAKTLNAVTVDDIHDFLTNYGKCTLPEDDENTSRSKQTVERCVTYVIDFWENVIRLDKNCNIKRDELYMDKNVRNKHGKTTKIKVPAFPVLYNSTVKKELLRDIPNKAFDLLLSIIIQNHRNILGLVACSAFAGLRPSEACNVRREDSKLGPGILFSSSNGEITRVIIDLTSEKNLRSDLKPVGKIKKERKADIPPLFIPAFVDCHNMYMDYMSGKKYEADYGAYTVNLQGKAMIYQSYYDKFTTIVKEELRPLCLRSDNPEVVTFGHILMNHNLSPHVFRHWYTVQLVLSGVDEVATLMYYRGDKSPESALTYLANKGELAKQFKNVSNDVMGYLLNLSNERMK